MITIIVPVYNKEKYVKACLNSLVKQTYKDIEIIVIDDGSKDKSLKICEEIAKKDNRISVYSKENAGVASARNMGIEKAKGDRIAFIDADDYVKENYIETLAQYNEDLVGCSYIMVDDEKVKYGDRTELLCNTPDEIRKECLKSKYAKLLVPVYLKLFKRDIIEQNNLKFNIDLSFGEDASFSFDYISHSNSVRLISYFGYCNVVYQGSLSRKYVENLYEQSLMLYETIQKLKTTDNSEDIYFWAFRNIKLILYNEKRSNYQKFKQQARLVTQYKDFDKLKLDNSNLSVTDKIIMILLKMKAYVFLYMIYHNRR